MGNWVARVSPIFFGSERSSTEVPESVAGMEPGHSQRL